MNIQNKQNTSPAFALLHGAALEPLSEIRFHTTWRGTRAVRCQAPQNPLTLQTSPGGTTLTTKRYAL